jgi:Tfp pilus assembly protein FimT
VKRDFAENGGFTLLDLVMVILIIGVLGVIIVPQYFSLTDQAKLDEGAAELVSALQYAGNLAVQHQRPFGVKASVADNSFSVFDTDPKPNAAPPAQPNNLPPVDAGGTVLHPLDKTWYSRSFNTLQSFQGVGITAVPAGGEVRFYPDGHSGAADSLFSLSYAVRQKTITVNGTTGQITVQ